MMKLTPKFLPNDIVVRQDGNSESTITTIKYIITSDNKYLYCLEGWGSLFEEKDLMDYFKWANKHNLG